MPQRQSSLVDRVAAILADMPLPKPPESLAEVLATEVPPDWTERPFEWESWAALPTSQPSIEKIDRTETGNQGRDRRDYAVRVWDREVSRTFYHKDKFWYLNDTGRWYSYPKTDLINILEGTDLFSNRPLGRNERTAWQKEKTNTFIRRIQTKNPADFVGELPGYLSGLVTHKNRTFLIINGPELIEPAPGDYKPVLNVLLEVLGEEQTEYLLAWLTMADRYLRAGNRVSGQMLIIGGKKDSGKTFIKEHIIRPILGGRHADPSEYLKGGKFNDDVFEAESWEIDDGVGTKEKRQVLTGAVKKITATSEFRIEAKYFKGMQSPLVFVRIHAYVNTDNESDLFAIPEVTDSIRDKLIVLHASQSKHERQSTILPDASVEGAQKAFGEKIRAAMPAFVHFIQTRVIPEKYRGARFGVDPYINPDIEKVLHKASDEGKLLDLIDKLVFTYNKKTEPWEGTASELDLLLSESARFANQMKDLERVKWKGDAIGSGLAVLAKQPGSRVAKRTRQGGARGWVIQPPEGHIERMLEKKAEVRKKSSVGYVAIAPTNQG